MQKRIVVYSIADEAVRLAFGAEIYQIDPNCVEIINQHATVFRSDKNKDELHKILVSSCLQLGDEAWILSLGEDFTGNGVVLDDLRFFFKG
jgi:hypothetical protein